MNFRARHHPQQLALGLPGVPTAALTAAATPTARQGAARRPARSGGARRLRAVPDLPTTPAPPPPPVRRVSRPVGPGELRGPADTPRQFRAVDLRVEQLDTGWWRFTMPRVPEWGAAARNPGEVVAAIRRSFTERQIQGYSDFRGTVYDGATTHRRHMPSARSSRRCDVYQPTEWKLHEDGRWVSPRGHKYPEHTQAVQRVMAARRALGLPSRPDPAQPEPTKQAAAESTAGVQDLDALQQGRPA